MARDGGALMLWPVATVAMETFASARVKGQRDERGPIGERSVHVKHTRTCTETRKKAALKSNKHLCVVCTCYLAKLYQSVAHTISGQMLL